MKRKPISTINNKKNFSNHTVPREVNVKKHNMRGGYRL